MLDNFNLLPPEAFTSSEKTVEKIIDKISDAVGWIVIPKGTKQYRLEAEQYLIEQVKNDPQMPPLAKAATISQVRKLIKEYLNQYNILSIALNFLNENVNPDLLNNDWISTFFDKAKNVSKEETSIIWGKLLAKEINTPGSVSLSLIHILSLMSPTDAESFKKLSNFCVLIDGKYYLIYFHDHNEFYHKNGILGENIIEAEDLGLLQFKSAGFYNEIDGNTKIKYFDCEWDITPSEIFVGNVLLSKAGKELISIIDDKQKIEEFANFLEKKLIKNHFDN